MMHSTRQVALAAGLVVLSSISLAASRAEFAVRWDPANGGPKSLKDVLTILKVHDAKSAQFDVNYLTVEPRAKPPEGYAIIGREREASGETEATYKIRGPEPLPAALANWTCPLQGGDSGKTEIDVTWTGEAAPKRSLSMSCSVDGAKLSTVLPSG